MKLPTTYLVVEQNPAIVLLHLCASFRVYNKEVSWMAHIWTGTHCLCSYVNVIYLSLPNFLFSVTCCPWSFLPSCVQSATPPLLLSSCLFPVTDSSHGSHHLMPLRPWCLLTDRSINIMSIKGSYLEIQTSCRTVLKFNRRASASVPYL